MQNLKKSVRNTYFVGSGAIATSGRPAELAPLQIGLFDAKTNRALPVGTTVKDASVVYLAMGSPNTKNLVDMATLPFKSLPIKGSKLTGWRKVLPSRKRQTKVAIGWDGVDDTKTLSPKCDSTYSYYVALEGSPISRYLPGRTLGVDLTYVTECCPECTPGSCDDTADALKMAESLVKQFNSNENVNKFAKASKLLKYAVAPTFTTLSFTDYLLSLCDEGDTMALARVQATYGASVVRESRVGTISTYKLTQATSLPAPADFSTGAIRTIPSCTTCPSGYTLVKGNYRFTLERSDLGEATALADVISQYPTGTAYRFKYEFGTSTYVVFNTTSTLAPAKTGDIITTFGIEDSYCQLDTPVDVKWVAAGTCLKYQRELTLTIGDGECGALDDAEVIEYYASEPSVVQGSVVVTNGDGCASSVTIKQWSDNCVVAGCTEPELIFKELPSFKGFGWKEVVTVPTTAPTNVGIVIESISSETTFSDCAFEFDDFVETDIVRIIAREENAFEGSRCDSITPITELVKPEIAQGLGEFVLRNYIVNQQDKLQPFKETPRWREIYGYKYDFIKRDAFYKTYYLEFDSIGENGQYSNDTMDLKVTAAISFEETVDTTQFENLLNAYVSSSSANLDLV